MSKSDFETLAELNVNEHTEKKGQFTYLSWAWAHDYLARLDPEFDWWLHDFPASAEGQIKWPYMATPAGCFVRVTVKFKGKERTHTYPILNHQNRPIPADQLTSFDVNTAQMRAFAKCCALHGLGLYIFSGEDLPKGPDLADIPAHKVQVLGGKYDGMTLGDIATQGGRAGIGYIYWLSCQNNDMAKKAKEVWDAHRPELTDEQVHDELQDAESLDELTGLYRCMTSEQQENFKEQFAARKAELAPPKRNAETARG